MQKGHIVELNERSSGLIERAGVEEHLFFHADALVDVAFKSLHTGDTLSFTVVESRKGPYATQIRKV